MISTLFSSYYSPGAAAAAQLGFYPLAPAQAAAGPSRKAGCECDTCLVSVAFSKDFERKITCFDKSVIRV